MAQTKRRINIALPPALLDRVDAEYPLHGFESRGEFVGKAVEFYLGFLQANNCDEYIHSTILTSMGDKLKLLEARMCKQLFRLCVELSMVEHFFAAQMDMLDDPADLQRLRKRCVDAVRETTGSIQFDRIYAFQKSLDAEEADAFEEGY